MMTAHHDEGALKGRSFLFLPAVPWCSGAAASEGGKKQKGTQKPAEHRALFKGNTDDHFR
jgi:hypothetical protein